MKCLKVQLNYFWAFEGTVFSPFRLKEIPVDMFVMALSAEENGRLNGMCSTSHPLCFIANRTSEQESYSKSTVLKGKLFFLKTNGCVIGLLGRLISCWWQWGMLGKQPGTLLLKDWKVCPGITHWELRECVFFKELFWRIHSASCSSL